MIIGIIIRSLFPMNLYIGASSLKNTPCLSISEICQQGVSFLNFNAAGLDIRSRAAYSQYQSMEYMMDMELAVTPFRLELATTLV